jgi:hypothetical protein
VTSYRLAVNLFSRIFTGEGSMGCWHKAFVTLHDVMEITKGQPWRNSSQSSVFWRGAEYHCKIAEFFLLHKYKKIIKSKFRASKTLLNSAICNNKERIF